MDELDKPVKRFLNFIFGVGIATPTFQEKGMAVASSASTASACLSRQVGAAVYSESGELLGVGANDVPKFGGGLYSVEGDNAEDHKKDMRCAVWKGQICHNDYEKSLIIQEIVDSINPYLAEGYDKSK
jgi:deoxycytidylate deaminase